MADHPPELPDNVTRISDHRDDLPVDDDATGEQIARMLFWACAVGALMWVGIFFAGRWLWQSL